MNRDQKVRIVAELKEGFSGANATFLVDYKGVGVAQMQLLRRSLREKDAGLRVAKVNLMEIAASGMDGAEWGDVSWRGQIGLVFAHGEVPAVAKALVDFSKENEALELKAGLFESKFMGSDAVRVLAALPSRQVLLGMLAGALNGPISGLARTLNALPGGLARSLQAVVDKTEAVSE